MQKIGLLLVFILVAVIELTQPTNSKFSLASCNFPELIQNAQNAFANLNQSENSIFIDSYSKIQSADDINRQYRTTLPDQFAVWGLKLDNSRGKSQYKYQNWEQNIREEKNRLGKWKYRNHTYFLKPDFTPNYESSAYEFSEKFPNYSIPKDKIVVMECNYLKNQNSNSLLKKGVTLKREDKVGPNSNFYKFIGDQWLLELGMPTQYNSSQEEFDRWTQNLDAKKLLEKFKNTFNPYSNYGLIEWNAEDNIGRWWKNRWKIEACFDFWQSQNNNARISAWSHHPYQLNRAVWQDSNYLIDWKNLPKTNPIYGLNYGMTDFHKNLDVWEIGGYVLAINNHNIICHYLSEFFLNDWARKDIGKPDIKLLYSIFADLECQVDNHIKPNELKKQTKRGVSYLLFEKPVVFPQDMFNIGVWSVAVGDGFILWDDPLWYLDENTNEYPGYVYDFKNNREVNLFSPSGGAQRFRNRKNVDWLMSGVWAVSQNKDIIEANSEWVFPKMPDVVAKEKGLLLAYKKVGNEILILALNQALDQNKTVNHTIKILNKTFNIQTHGYYTSVIRTGLDVDEEKCD